MTHFYNPSLADLPREALDSDLGKWYISLLSMFYEAEAELDHQQLEDDIVGMAYASGFYDCIDCQLSALRGVFARGKR